MELWSWDKQGARTEINFKVGLTTDIIHKHNQDIDVQKSGQTFYVTCKIKTLHAVSDNVKEKKINERYWQPKEMLSHCFGMWKRQILSCISSTHSNIININKLIYWCFSLVSSLETTSKKNKNHPIKLEVKCLGVLWYIDPNLILTENFFFDYFQ